MCLHTCVQPSSRQEADGGFVMLLTFPNSFTIISDEVSQELPEVLKFTQEFGLPGFELRSIFGKAYKDLSDRDVGEIDSVRRHEGLCIVGCASSVFKCSINDETGIRQSIDQFERALEMARKLDCRLIRVFTFLRESSVLDVSTLARVCEQLYRLITLAQGSGVRIGVENENSCTVATSTELVQLLGQITDLDLGAIWDPCNVLFLPQAPAPKAEEFRALRPRILHMHLKDAVRRSSQDSGAAAAEIMPFGLGEVGWRDFFEELLRCSYTGMLSLETHWRAQRLNDQLLHLPAGLSFSHGGAEASRICMQNVKALFGSLP